MLMFDEEKQIVDRYHEFAQMEIQHVKKSLELQYKYITDTFEKGLASANIEQLAIACEYIEDAGNSISTKENVKSKDWQRQYRALKSAYNQLYDTARALLDVTEYDGEGAEMRELRKLLWSDDDTEAKIEAERG